MAAGALLRRLGAADAPRRGAFGWIVPALLALAVALPWLVEDFYLRLAIEALLLGAVALSVDVLLGFGGLLSLGQAMYFGLSAYLTALCYLHLTQSFWLVAGIVAVAVALVAAVLGAVAIRARASTSRSSPSAWRRSPARSSTTPVRSAARTA